jgi:hypothetical protein
MVKIRYSAIGMSLIAVLMISSLPRNVRAAGGADGEARIRLHATALAGPIGSVNAFGSVNINGKQVTGEEVLWGGELIEATHGAATSVSFDSIGSVTLTEGAAARFSATRSASDEAGRLVLIASLLRGNVAIELHPEAGAYVEAGGARFTAMRGASFRIEMQDGQAVLNTISGTVNTEPRQSRPNYKIRPVDELGRPVDLGRTLSVRARSTRNFQIQVTDENDKPIPDLPILFSLGSPCLGSLGVGAAAGTSFRKKTDNKGIAAVPFIVGAAKCLGSLSAKVEGTNTEFTQQVGVQRHGFWNTQNSLLVAGIVGGGVLAAVLIINSGGNNNQRIQPVPPPVVKP